MIEEVEDLTHKKDVVALLEGEGLLQTTIDAVDGAAIERVTAHGVLSRRDGCVVVAWIVVDLGSGQEGAVAAGSVEEGAGAGGGGVGGA